jgi:hypothetical protein
MRIAVVLCALLAGCTAHIHVEGGRSLAALVGLSYLAAAAYSEEGGSPSREAPQLDPERRVSEQDCSKPIDYTLGNIRCK